MVVGKMIKYMHAMRLHARFMALMVLAADEPEEDLKERVGQAIPFVSMHTDDTCLICRSSPSYRKKQSGYDPVSTRCVSSVGLLIAFPYLRQILLLRMSPQQHSSV